jgi:uncharacterized iron-regulated membrane protein
MIVGNVRSFFKKLHLGIALAGGLFFVILGLTGSVIAWLPELDRALNPELLISSKAHAESAHIEPSRTFQIDPADAQKVIDRLTADPVYGRPTQLTLPETAADVYVASYRPPKSLLQKPSSFAMPVSRQVMVDPDSLQVKGERAWGSIGWSRAQLMPTIFYLHRVLLLGETGKTLTGIIALALLFMSITGLVLWLPRAKLSALRHALRISYSGSWPRLQFSFHRATGFFAAPVLIVLAFSGLYFNVPSWVLPVVGSVMTVSKNEKINNQFPHQAAQMISITDAMRHAQSRYPDARISRIGLPAKPNEPYEIRVRQPNEIQKNDGATRMKLDAFSGEVLQVRDPLKGASGDVFLSWMFPLHSGEAFGLWGRVFISMFGVMPLLLALTGLLMWRRKRTRV